MKAKGATKTTVEADGDSSQEDLSISASAPAWALAAGKRHSSKRKRTCTSNDEDSTAGVEKKFRKMAIANPKKTSDEFVGIALPAVAPSNPIAETAFGLSALTFKNVDIYANEYHSEDAFAVALEAQLEKMHEPIEYPDPDALGY